ncbi:MAG TPA: hypothetical protein VNU74_11040 [Terriglobales bacterium]|nr:hypothetical protein [Terriglobales bacterium]
MRTTIGYDKTIAKVGTAPLAAPDGSVTRITITPSAVTDALL